jgi:acetyltransferase
MHIRNLDPLFDPVSVAVFGASQRPASMGAAAWRNVRGSQFRGPVYAVNPKCRKLDGEPVFARAADLPTVSQLAVICTPPAKVAGLIAEPSSAPTSRLGDWASC